MGKKYENEHDGQVAFFDAFGIDWENEPVLVENTDGIHNGVLLEFKLNIKNLNAAVFQAIKYLSNLRLKGRDVPATFLVVDLNKATAYEYKSKDYKAEIHKVYRGAASKNNTGFTAKPCSRKYEYDKDLDASKLRHLLKDSKTLDKLVLPIDIDEDCIVAWAERYYAENPTASKGDFLGDDTGNAVKITGEIREPKHFKGRINKYTGKSNEKFKYLMDCLNDRLSKKDLGAFYTPIEYARKAGELVMKAVERVPEGNDYIILDRCAGTGNLEAGLIGLVDANGDELIGHCVVSTYEYYEYKVLQERLGDKVRDIIPPTEANVVYEHGTIANADAMSEEFIKNEVIRQYVDDPNCTVILFENPPFSDTSASDNATDSGKRKKAKSNRKEKFITKKFVENLSKFDESKGSYREISNLFIWSGFEYYLRQESDSYVCFSPVKYFKQVGIAKKQYLGGFAFNRKHFHAQEGLVSCVLWANIDEARESFKLSAYDIDKDRNVVPLANEIVVKKVHKTLLPLFDKRAFDGDIKTTVWCEGDGSEVGSNRKCDSASLYNENIIGYLRASSYPIAPLNRFLTRQIHYSGRGFYLRRENYKDKLPLWVAKMFPADEWHEKDVFATTSDGGDKYTKDEEFLKACLIYTCLSNQNKCLSFRGSDGRDYQNELCLDDGALAKKDLDGYTLDEDEKELVALWDKILAAAKKTANYDGKWRYGIYQITKELNTSRKEKVGNKTMTVYDYPELNGDLETLRRKLKDYYKSHITKKMFEYELLK